LQYRTVALSVRTEAFSFSVKRIVLRTPASAITKLGKRSKPSINLIDVIDVNKMNNGAV